MTPTFFLEPTHDWGAGGGGGVNLPDLPSSLSPEQNLQYDERFQLTDEETGAPLRNVSYVITDENGKKYRGRTDEQGLTSRIYTPTGRVGFVDVAIVKG